MLALGVSTAFAAGTPTAGTPNAACASPVAATPDANGLIAPPCGADGTLEGFDITVKGSMTASTLTTSIEQFTTRGEFLAVYLTVTNSGNDPAEFSANDLMVSTSSGKNYDINEEATINYSVENNAPAYTTLQPDLPSDVIVVFELAAGQSGFTLYSPKDETFSIRLT
jgi:Domain of unknown function (DUF4352)